MAQTGTLTLRKATVSGSTSKPEGNSTKGALYNHGGILSVVSSTISGNTGCGISNEGYYAPTRDSGRATVNSSIVSGNTICGIRTFYTQSLTVTNSTIANNQGDGIIPDTTSARVINSTISGNGGSGIFTGEYSFTSIVNSTITGNAGTKSRGTVVDPGPGIPPAGRLGGGVYVGYGSGVSASNSTISGNSANVGGALYIGGGGYNGASLSNTTVTGNTATWGGGISIGGLGSELELHRTILSGNTATTGREAFVTQNRQVTVTAGDFNVIGFGGNAGVAGFAPGVTDIVPAQPLNRVLNTRLANNGGATRTHELVAGSSAIDSVNDGTCPPPARDQRGIKRPQDGNGDGGPACDSGSYERAAGG